MRFRKVLNPQIKSVLKGLGCKKVPGTIMRALPAVQIARKGLVGPRHVLVVRKTKLVLLTSAQKRHGRRSAVALTGEVNSQWSLC